MAAVVGAAKPLIAAGAGLITHVTDLVMESKEADLKNQKQSQIDMQNAAPGHEGALCGSTGTMCRAGLVCSPLKEVRHAKTADYNNGRCVDYTKERGFGETCDSTGVLHCKHDWGCMDASSKNWRDTFKAIFKGPIPPLRKCGYCKNDLDCPGERWCGTSNGGSKKMCQGGEKPKVSIIKCASNFSYNNDLYQNNACVTFPKIFGPDAIARNWCPTVVDQNLAYTVKTGAPEGLFGEVAGFEMLPHKYKNILLCEGKTSRK